MTIATDLQEDIEAMVVDLGDATLTITQIVEGALVDVNAPSKGYAKTPTDTTVTGILTDFETEYIDGDAVQRGDMKAIVETNGLAITIARGDTLTDDDAVEWNVINVEHPKVSSVKVVAILHLRK